MSLGQSNPHELAESLPEHVLEQWRAFDMVEPLAQPWLQTAVVAQKVAEVLTAYLMVHGGKSGKKIPWPRIDDFMPTMPGSSDRQPAEPPKQSAQEMMVVAQQIAGAGKHGGNR